MSSVDLQTVALWEYRDIAAPLPVVAERMPALHEAPAALPLPVLFTQEELAAKISLALAAERKEAEQTAQAQEAHRSAQLRSTLTAFAAERVAYFRSLETEVVQLSLAIARKILQREAQLDRTLLVGLVRVALDGVRAEPPVRLRVAPAAVQEWTTHRATWPALGSCEVFADATLQPGDCLIETELGTAQLGLEAQLKEVEASFADLLARRPEIE